MPFADAQSQPRVAESIRQGADADLAQLKGAPFLKNAVELPFEPHVLEKTKPAVRFHLNVLHCAAEHRGRPEHYSISFTACHGQAAPEAVSTESRFAQAHSAGLTGKCIFLLRCRSKKHRGPPGSS